VDEGQKVERRNRLRLQLDERSSTQTVSYVGFDHTKLRSVGECDNYAT